MLEMSVPTLPSPLSHLATSPLWKTATKWRWSVRGASSLSSPRFGAILHFQVAELLFSSVSTSTSQAKSNKQTRPPLSFFANLRERERERETNLDARAPQMQKDTDVSLTMRTINVYSTNNENCMHNEATHERSWRSIARFSIDIPEQCEGMEARNSLPPDDEDLFMPFIWRFQMFLILWPKRRTTLREFENLFSPYRRMAFPMKYFQYPSTSLQGFSPSSLGTNDSLWHLASFSFHSLDISAPEQALILYRMWLRLHR